MYTTDNVINAMEVAADPEQRGLILTWAEKVVAWADANLSDYERSRILEVHRARFT